jgi:hypothetical protein
VPSIFSSLLQHLADALASPCLVVYPRLKCRVHDFPLNAIHHPQRDQEVVAVRAKIQTCALQALRAVG